MYAVIAENDESQWSDETGVRYHFPNQYKTLLQPGTQVIYYTGKTKGPQFATKRLSSAPHYFGVATIGKVERDASSVKVAWFATIENFKRFVEPIPIKANGEYLEFIPPSKHSNYWRNGVRSADAEIYRRIMALAKIKGTTFEAAEPADAAAPGEPSDDLTSEEEGQPSLRYVTTYERSRKNRELALAIHGYRCKACGEDMQEKYGEHAAGLIHIHHVVPVSEYEAPKRVDPKLDLVPVCPNCHSVIHYRKNMTLTVEAVREMLKKA